MTAHLRLNARFVWGLLTWNWTTQCCTKLHYIDIGQACASLAIFIIGVPVPEGQKQVKLSKKGRQLLEEVRLKKILECDETFLTVSRDTTQGKLGFEGQVT